MANSPLYPISDPISSTCDEPTESGSTRIAHADVAAEASLSVRSESMVTTGISLPPRAA